MKTALEIRLLTTVDSLEKQVSVLEARVEAQYQNIWAILDFLGQEIEEIPGEQPKSSTSSCSSTSPCKVRLKKRREEKE